MKPSNEAKLTKEQTAEVLLTIISDALNESLNYTWKDDPDGFGFILQDLIQIKRKIRKVLNNVDPS